MEEVKWVKKGDCNSKFFHKVANGRRNRKYIKELENERGLVLNNAERITEEILLYFEKLYTSPTGESWSVEGLDWSPILEESALRLDSPFIEEEISKAIFQLDRDKAPGPDGFTITVFQDCWDVIKEDLVRVFAEFHRSGIINQSTNASFIVLLPKKSLTKKISDFRPISLITSLYKIIAKVLSGRLRGILHETIHSTQGTFVQGRQIFDAVLIVNEIVDERRRSGEEGVVFKIDFEKAHDHVKEEDLQTLKSLLLAFGHISELKLPASVAAKIERLQKDFLWSEIGEGKRDHLVRWDVVCKPKEIGGLGFENISLRNLALLGKWLWSQMITSLSLEGYCTSLSGVFLVYLVFPSKFVWNSQVPFKVKSFVWLVTHKKLAKMDWVPPRSIFDMMSIKFNGFGSSKRGLVLWQAASIALIRLVWWERNVRIFEDKVRNSEYLWDSIVFLASLWAFYSKVFKGTPLNVLQLDWLAVCTP
ncbi:Transposon TX1 uncharacterized 149 kDa protein [Vitis vinifera]|uniref:Transposon TX1 uncharacterized 149 kDa protein n=1 Tax=Vitis vinifera TaxID=29760 RepID=A0A438DH97_VITVI|nr:Transposon TX1 uncharacterized 149 kDa protein [Vitis vinifera]